MSIEIIGILTTFFGVISLNGKPEFGFYLFLTCTLLGASAAFLVPGLGTIQPGQEMLIFALLIVGKDRNMAFAAFDAIRFPKAGFWLLCTCVYGAFSSFFMPRILAGNFPINAVSSVEYTLAYHPIPLKPTTGNITQAVYLVGDVVAFCLFYAFASSRKGYASLAQACLIYGSCNIAFAFADILTSHTGSSWLLGYLRNANYVIYEDAAVGDVQRIIGSFPEASAFAYATIGIMCFSLRLFLGRIHTRWSLAVASVSFMLLLLSTSSTALLALAACLSLIVLGIVVRSMKSHASQFDAALLIMAPLAMVTASCIVMLDDHWYQAFHAYLNDVLLAKSLSASGIERAQLNNAAWHAFLDSDFLGAGVGSIRTSSFILAVLANMGIVGAIFYAFFLAECLPRYRPITMSSEDTIRAAARVACVGLLVAACISGGLIDLGLAFFAFAALAVAPARNAIDCPGSNTCETARALA